ncbi:Gfo/Idh/MocA family protein [Actinomadura alba]|uniref:Gfo/Idh/MocA family oxidoreductase n=1 Tax=Actinomadura alba TaxID=406431 RepID=A0ABR7LPN8_9ACTN|nr:Gfo/Idh/MocA family oxidoreductase [Actinomadura alba]MBC6466638.1 Gfo/Idh/MocA family oxidoreductase [Actinomadura alba]
MVGVGSRTTDVLLPALQEAAVPLRVTAICDPASTTAAQVGDLAQRGLLPVGVEVYGDLGDALAAGSYEVAILACPHDEHQSLTLRLADAGIAVWKEKPYALTLNDAVQLATLAHPGVRVLAHRPHSHLHQIAIQRLQDWGQLLSYRIRITRQTSDYSATWRASRQRAGGGAILDLGYHAFDLISRLAGHPAAVYAVTTASPAHRAAVEVGGERASDDHSRRRVYRHGISLTLRRLGRGTRPGHQPRPHDHRRPSRRDSGH